MFSLPSMETTEEQGWSKEKSRLLIHLHWKTVELLLIVKGIYSRRKQYNKQSERSPNWTCITILQLQETRWPGFSKNRSLDWKIGMWWVIRLSLSLNSYNLSALGVPLIWVCSATHGAARISFMAAICCNNKVIMEKRVKGISGDKWGRGKE